MSAVEALAEVSDCEQCDGMGVVRCWNPRHHCEKCPTLCTEDHTPQESAVDGAEFECPECAYIVAYDAARNEWVPA